MWTDAALNKHWVTFVCPLRSGEAMWISTTDRQWDDLTVCLCTDETPQGVGWHAMSDEVSSRRRLLPCLIENRGPTQPNSQVCLMQSIWCKPKQLFCRWFISGGRQGIFYSAVLLSNSCSLSDFMEDVRWSINRSNELKPRPVMHICFCNASYL